MTTLGEKVLLSAFLAISHRRTQSIYPLAAQSQSGRPSHITKDNPAVFAAGSGLREHMNIVFINTSTTDILDV
jgi:hypothetical protein